MELEKNGKVRLKKSLMRKFSEEQKSELTQANTELCLAKETSMDWTRFET